MRVPSTQLQNNFGRYLKYVEVHEEIIITKKGKDVARIVPCEEQKAEYVMEGSVEYQTEGRWVTYEEFLELAENSEQRFELIDGVVFNLESPSYEHQHAVHEIHGTFYNWFKDKECIPLTSPFDVKLFKDEKNICVVQPDILVMCDRQNIDKKGRYAGIPMLVIEVLSPASRSKDMLKKLELYKKCKIKEYWLVDTKNRQILVYSLDDNDIKELRVYQKGANEYVESAVFTGLKAAVGDIFVE
jgi:prevent-host-death family protein